MRDSSLSKSNPSLGDLLLKRTAYHITYTTANFLWVVGEIDKIIMTVYVEKTVMATPYVCHLVDGDQLD